MLKRTMKYLAMCLVGMMLAAATACDPVGFVQNEINSGRAVSDVALIGTLMGMAT